METFLRHRPVVVMVAAAIAFGFYYYAPPYDTYLRRVMAKVEDAGIEGRSRRVEGHAAETFRDRR